MQPFPEKMMEIGMIVAGAVGLLILIAPNFGLKPKATVDGWRFPVKPTCLLLYYLALTGGIGAVAFGATQLAGLRQLPTGLAGPALASAFSWFPWCWPTGRNR